MPASETERIRRIYDRVSRRYDRTIGVMERLFFRGGREWVCNQARGDVLEIALGTGRNLSLYPPVVRLAGIELSEQMLAIARRRARDLGVDADLRRGDAQALPFPDESFDSVVCTLSMCAIPDERRALAEGYRVLRPGGILLLLDHVASDVSWVRFGQRLLEPIAVRFEGDHLQRRPVKLLPALGFVVEAAERSKAGIVERVRARKPA